MITRRRALRGMLGGSAFALGLPLFERMLNTNGTALAQGALLPKRYGLFFWGGGLPWNVRHANSVDQNFQHEVLEPDQWTPTTTGKGFEITEHMQPLARHQGNFSVVTGLEPHTDIPTDPPGQGDGHMRGVCVSLSGDKIKTECTYNNDTGAPITYGESSDTEMCYSLLYRYPKQSTEFCND